MNYIDCFENECLWCDTVNYSLANNPFSNGVFFFLIKTCTNYSLFSFSNKFFIKKNKLKWNSPPASIRYRKAKSTITKTYSFPFKNLNDRGDVVIPIFIQTNYPYWRNGNCFFFLKHKFGWNKKEEKIFTTFLYKLNTEEIWNNSLFRQITPMVMMELLRIKLKIILNVTRAQIGMCMQRSCKYYLCLQESSDKYIFFVMNLM